jgi:hypothetical protein
VSHMGLLAAWMFLLARSSDEDGPCMAIWPRVTALTCLEVLVQAQPSQCAVSWLLLLCRQGSVYAFKSGRRIDDLFTPDARISE